LASDGSMDGYTTTMYFIVLPAVLGPVCAALFVVAVYLCRRRRYDDDNAAGGRFVVKRAPTVVVSSACPPTSTAEYRRRALSSRGRAGGSVEAGIDEESEMMLPAVGAAPAALFFSPPALPVPGMASLMSIILVS